MNRYQKLSALDRELTLYLPPLITIRTAAIL